MPNDIIKSFAKQTGKSIDKIEKYWDLAVKEAEKMFNIKQKDFKDKQYKFIVGMVKNMAGIKESKQYTKKFLESEKNAKQFIEELAGMVTTSNINDLNKQQIIIKNRQEEKDDEKNTEDSNNEYLDNSYIQEEDNEFENDIDDEINYNAILNDNEDIDVEDETYNINNDNQFIIDDIQIDKNEEIEYDVSDMPLDI